MLEDEQRGTLGSKVDAAARQAFFGRAPELSRLVELMRRSERLPRVVQLLGPAGIGKTSLLQMWRQECRRLGLGPVILVDSREFPHTVVGLTSLLEQRLGSWPPRAPGPLGLAVDSFEEMADMEWKFREGILRHLEGEVLVVLAGRRMTPLAEAAAGWRDVVEEMTLGELDGGEARALLRACGVTEEGAIESIVAVARGNPLALAFAGDLWVKLGIRDFVTDRPALLQSLLRRFTSEVQDEELGGLLEAAAMVRSFDQELIASMVDGVSNQAFARFCQLSLIHPGSDGRFHLHDLVRRMVAADLQQRKPAAYRRLRQLAYQHLLQVATSGEEVSYDALLELMFLSEEVLIHAALLLEPVERPPELRPVLPHEHHTVRRLAERWGVGPAAARPEAARAQLDLFLQLAPERFLFALDSAGTPVGFCNTLPLNRATLPALRDLWPSYFDRIDPRELSTYRAAAEGEAWAGLAAGFLVAPPDAAVRSALLRTAILRAALETQRLLAVAPHEEYTPLLERLHFVKAGTGRRRRRPGEVVEVFALDLSELGFEGWIQDLLGIQAPATTGGRLSGALVGLVSQPGPSSLQEKLSPRELELLAAVARGLPNKQIARLLSISQNTVRNHLTVIYRKLSIPDRSQAILYAIREGLVEVG